MRSATTQRGLTLVELLAALAIAALLVAPIAISAQQGLRAQSIAREAGDVSEQARFAMQRVTAAVRATAPRTLPAKAANTTADWLSPVAFCRNASAASLMETTPADSACSAGRVIAQGVSAFSVQSVSAGVGAAKVLEIQLTVAGNGGQSISLTSRARLGGGML